MMPGHPSHRPPGDAAHYPERPAHSLMLVHLDIPPGGIVRVATADNAIQAQWTGGPYFMPAHLIYVGSPDLWLRADSQVAGCLIEGAPLALESFRPPAPTFVDWPVIGILAHHLELFIENRGDAQGHFIARLAGMFNDQRRDVYSPLSHGTPWAARRP